MPFKCEMKRREWELKYRRGLPQEIKVRYHRRDNITKKKLRNRRKIIINRYKIEFYSLSFGLTSNWISILVFN